MTAGFLTEEGLEPEALADSIARYQKLGCWEGELEISRALYEQALEVFMHGGAISTRHPYEDIVIRPPT